MRIIFCGKGCEKLAPAFSRLFPNWRSEVIVMAEPVKPVRTTYLEREDVADLRHGDHGDGTEEGDHA